MTARKAMPKSGRRGPPKPVRRGAAEPAAAALRIWEDGARELVFALDLEHRVLFASPAARELLGVTPAALGGTRFEARMPAQDQAAASAWFSSVAAGAQPPPLVHRLSRRDGRELWAETTARRTRSTAAEPAQIRGACRDIDRHKRFEINVERVAQQWRATVDATSDAILMLDIHRRVVRVNRPAAKLLNLPFGEILDQDVHALFAARLGLREPLGLADAMASGERSEDEVWVPRRRCWLHSEASPLRDGQGLVNGLVLVLHDVTERRRAEQRQERSHEQLRSLSTYFQEISERSRAALAREIHDELGALLTALKLDLAWIKSKLGAEHATLRERAQAAVEISNQAIAAVRRISTELHPSVLDALGLPAAIEWHCRELQKRSDLEVHVDLPPEELMFEPPVATSLFRILQEATTNVVRHAAANRLSVRLWLERGSAWLRIEDDGKGFERRKLNSSRGFGLGLLGMEDRGAMIGAQVTIRSRPGKGTVVLVRRRLKP
ncbi:MAG: PAS domain-containing protein [Acidobacteriota bacterium]